MKRNNGDRVKLIGGCISGTVSSEMSSQKPTPRVMYFVSWDDGTFNWVNEGDIEKGDEEYAK